jgi:hypothetical protein
MLVNRFLVAGVLLAAPVLSHADMFAPDPRAQKLVSHIQRVEAQQSAMDMRIKKIEMMNAEADEAKRNLASDVRGVVARGGAGTPDAPKRKLIGTLNGKKLYEEEGDIHVE